MELLFLYVQHLLWHTLQQWSQTSTSFFHWMLPVLERERQLRQGWNSWKQNPTRPFLKLKRQSRNPSSSFVHTPPTIEQKIDMAFVGFLLDMCFSWKDTTRKLHALSHSGTYICHCNSLHKQDLRSIASLPRHTVQGSLALLLQLSFHKFSPAAKRYWDGIRGFRGGLWLTGKMQ